jgi:acyl-coenzyme A thioesterase PaaI-like protein
MECYAVRRSVAFVRGVAFHEDEGDPIATCAATFARKHAAEPAEPSRAKEER